MARWSAIHRSNASRKLCSGGEGSKSARDRIINILTANRYENSAPLNSLRNSNEVHANQRRAAPVSIFLRWSWSWRPARCLPRISDSSHHERGRPHPKEEAGVKPSARWRLFQPKDLPSASSFWISGAGSQNSAFRPKAAVSWLAFRGAVFGRMSAAHATGMRNASDGLEETLDRQYPKEATCASATDARHWGQRGSAPARNAEISALTRSGSSR